MSFYRSSRLLPRRFRLVLASFLQRPGLPFADVISEESIQTAFHDERVSFADDEDAVYTPEVPLWAFLSQVLFKGEHRSCMAAVARVVVLRVALERGPCSGNTGAYCRARAKLSEAAKGATPAAVKALMETGTDTVRRLRRGLTNALRSAEKRWWRDDQNRGHLSPRTLHRLCMDRPRLDIFRVRGTVQGKSTAVSMLLDASGSMSSRKMDVARSSMRVLLEALGDLRIATEALTFTTGNCVDISDVMQQTGLDHRELRERYGRISNLEIGIIKGFDEPVKVGLQRLPIIKGTGLTPLGEAMQIAAARLVPRRENRKILLVLTDGKAGCEGGAEAATQHALDVATRITRAGIELIGVGILDQYVRDVVDDAIVIHRIEDLSAQLCKLLGRTLIKGVQRVAREYRVSRAG